MTKSRIEAFSDGVIAIIITIMVLEFRVIKVHDWTSLKPILPTFAGYVLSFVFVGIYWNNHHHLLQSARKVTGSIMWANLHLLFWLSLIPYVTNLMTENSYSSIPVSLYGVVLLMAAIAYTILTASLIRRHGHDSVLARAIGRDFKGRISLLCYAVAIPLAFVHPAISGALYHLVAIIWLVPDRRIEHALTQDNEAEHP